MKDYFTFTDGETKYLRDMNDTYNDMLSPYATRDVTAIRARDYTPRYDLIRPPYSYDVDCIIHNPLYNRYTDKTQVSCTRRISPIESRERAW